MTSRISVEPAYRGGGGAQGDVRVKVFIGFGSTGWWDRLQAMRQYTYCRGYFNADAPPYEGPFEIEVDP